MQKPGFNRSLFIVILIIITVAIAGCSSTSPTTPATGGTTPKATTAAAAPGSGGGTGTLFGNVTIGPLCPVEPCTVTPDRLTAVYAARTIVVSIPGAGVVAEAAPDPFTGYSFSLKPGTYVVDIKHQSIGGSPELPATFTIRAGETIRLDISIDTGIR